MRKLHLLSGLALSAWLIIVPADLSRAQSGGGGGGGGAAGGGGSAGGGSAGGGAAGGGAAGGGGAGAGAAQGGGATGGGGNVGPTTGVGGTNQNNAGAADRFRGQGIDRPSDYFNQNRVPSKADGRQRPVNNLRPQTRDGRQSNSGRSNGGRFNDGASNDRPNFNGTAVTNARDRIRSQSERLNDNDDFQSDPYQSSRSANEPRPYDRRLDAQERRQYQADLALDKAARESGVNDYEGDSFDRRNDARYRDPDDSRFQTNDRWRRDRSSRDRSSRDRWRNDDNNQGRNTGGGDVNVFVDDNDGYTNGGYYSEVRYGTTVTAPRGTARGDEQDMERIDRGGTRNRQPSRTTRQPLPDPSVDRGQGNFEKLPSERAREQSINRAVNHVDANLGREADDDLDNEFPDGTGIEAGRKMDARVDPRGR